MPFGYTDVAWAALTRIQKNTVAFAQLDANLVFGSDAAKASLFLEAVQYLRFYRPMQDSQNSRSFSYPDYESDVKRAHEVIDGAACSHTTSKSFILRRMIAR